MSVIGKRLTVRDRRMVARARLRNAWRRWQHRGARPYQQGVPAGIASPAHAEGLQAACRRRRLPCPWCGRGQP